MSNTANLAIKLGARRPLAHREIEVRVVRGTAIFLAVSEAEGRTT